jgi:hypothetical protein
MDAEPDQYRYERKFLVPVQSWAGIESSIKRNPGFFSDVFQPRMVNNIYLDSAGLACYFMNLDGSPHRTKIRIRWYGDLLGTLARPVLEFKIKNGLVGTKKSFPLKPFLLDANFNAEDLRMVLRKSDLPDAIRQQMDGLEPTLLNRYQRKYYRSADGGYRLTLDANLEFFRIRSCYNSFLCRAVNRDYRVLELKYDRSDWEGAERIANAFPFRVTRISKYVHGLDCLDGA